MGALDGALAALGGDPAAAKPAGRAASGGMPANDPGWKIPADVQASRDSESVKILNDELSQETDPTNQAALQREIARRGGNQAPASPAPASGPLDGAIGLLSGAPAPDAKPGIQYTDDSNNPNAIPGSGPRVEIAGVAKPEPSISNKLIGAGEAALSLGTGALSAIPGGIAAGVNVLTNGKYGTQAGVKEAGDRFSEVSGAYTYEPRTETGKNYLTAAGDAINDSGLQAVLPMAEGAALARASNPVSALVKDNVAAKVKVPAALAAADRVEPSLNGSAPQVAGSSAAEGMAAREMKGGGAASANGNPYPQFTGEEAARGGNSSFPQVKVAKMAGDVPQSEQAVRARIANEILGEDHGQVRPGVITGNENTLRSEYTHAKSPEKTPAQLVLANQIAKEQEALSNYAQQRIEATGAKPNLINNEQRGQLINDAFHGPEGLAEYFKGAKQQIYDMARTESGGNPIQSSHVDALLQDPQFMAEAERNGHTGVVSGAQKLISLARDTGFKDPITGEVLAPGSVAAWDAVRKSNNAGWTHENSRTIGAINRAIDQDVAAAAGSDAYKLGDAIHKAEKTIMDVPAIAKVFGGNDANGIKGGVPLEKLTQKLNNMPLDQWRHVYNTLDELSRGQVRGAPEGMPPVPAELQQLAAAAKNEISGALAREVYEQGAGKIGSWNQNSVNKTLNSVVGDKIRETFPPDEVQKFHTLNYGGQMMPGVHSYEGAALQSQRLSKPGFVENHATKAAAAAGGALGGAISGGAAAGAGATAGTWAGNKLASKAAASRLQGEANKLLEAMRANSELGRK